MAQNEMISEIDKIIHASLSEFVEDVFSTSWRGREREAVSLYALGFLQRQCQADRILCDPTQICLEAAVPSSLDLNPKGRVCKDLVLWSEPKMTCWNEKWEAVKPPLAILEWKVYRRPSLRAQVHPYDVTWLKNYSALYRDMFAGHSFVGYAVALDLLQRDFRLSVTRVENGQAEDNWLQL